MSRPFVVFAEGNLKGGCRVTLGPKTLLLGPTGSGKSTVANTVELALTGRVSDIVGRREVAKEVELMTLAPDRKGVLQARLRLSDGSECLWHAGGKSKKAHHKYPEGVVDVEAALPLRPVYNAVMGNIETARKFFMQYAVGVVADADVLARIPVALHMLYKRATLANSLSTTTAVDRLLMALEHAKKQAREAKATAKAAEGLSDTTAAGLAPLPTEAEDKAMRDALRAAEAERDAIRDRITRRETLSSALDEQTALKEKLEAAVAAYTLAKTQTLHAAAKLALCPAPQAIDPLVVAFRAVLRAHVDKHLANCEVCGHIGAPLPEGFAQRLASFDAHFASHADAVRQHETATTAHNTALIHEQQAMNTGKMLWARVESITATLGQGVTDAPDPVAILTVEEKVAGLTAKLREVDGLKASWAVASRARDGVGDARKTAKEWEELTGACVDAVAALLDGGVNGFVTRVQSALPGTDRFHLTLRDGDRAVFQFGLMHANVLHTALSGAEWARVTAAMAGVCTPSLRQVSVVIPEDRPFDAGMLTQVLTAFGHLDSQVIFTSPIAPITIPEGWTVIDTTTGDHLSGVDPVITPPALVLVENAEAPVVPQERAP